MRSPVPLAIPLAMLAFGAFGCSGSAASPSDAPPDSIAETAPLAARSAPLAQTSAPLARTAEDEKARCLARIATLTAQPDLGGAPAFDAKRPEFLGRAKGEPMVFVREPRATPDEGLPATWLTSRKLFEKANPAGNRVAQLRRRHLREPEALRALVLREGYAYAPDPLDALGIATELTLPDLFSEPEVFLQRGTTISRLERREVPKPHEVSYRYVDGPNKGRAAELLFGDRVGLRKEDLDAPLHRDLRALAEAEGFDRTVIHHRSEAAIVADLRFGERFVPAVLEADGADLKLGCMAADPTERAAIETHKQQTGARRRAVLAMHDVVAEELREALRFDRPEGVQNAERDGELRPSWMTAYLGGKESFAHDGASYAVFTPEGNPWPPQVCVDFVLDTFERTSGTWYGPKGGPLGRVKGKLDFDESKIPNRRGVMAFGKFAEDQPELFTFRRFVGNERIQFKERSRYFAFLLDHADEVRPGDVVAIHGLKRDEKIHQHAILVEWADPVTGFPCGLADQMKRPRRRTWEGIMAEAPLRSLLYRARPTEAVVEKLDPGE
ncbi:MAG: hypothetical protein U0359_20495 [Byssovorax sp.]